MMDDVSGLTGSEEYRGSKTSLSDSYQVTISYSPVDKQLAKRLQRSLQEENINTTILDGKSQYILKCKVFLLILSEDGINDEIIKDELALAYISNKSIIPIARNYYGPISSIMPSGMKLMLAKINWTFFVKDDDYDSQIDPLKDVILSLIEEMRELTLECSQLIDSEDNIEENLQIPNLRCHVQPESLEDTCEYTISKDKLKYDFWSRHFENKTMATWIDFRESFISDYGQKIENSYGQDKLKMFINILYNDILQLNHTVHKDIIDKFTNTADNKHLVTPHKFYDRLQTYVVGILAMKEVLEMNSTLRLVAIQNMGSFYSPAVTSLLIALTKDPTDPNTRAVAALSLVKSKGSRGKKNNEQIGKVLIKLLSDEDRLVRESACLCLANLKYQPAVDGIIHLWRNDPIKHVREAAELALHQIGGPQSATAIKVTAVLCAEIDRLKDNEF